MDVRASRVLKLRKVDKVLDTPPPRRTDFFMAFDRAAFFAAVRALQSRPTPNQTVSFAVDAKVVDICYEACAASCRARLGTIHFIRGWQLTAPPSSRFSILFGGLSSLIYQGSSTWLSVSDVGWLVELRQRSHDFLATVRLLHGADGQPIGAGPMTKDLKSLSNPEALALSSTAAEGLVAFEDAQRIVSYRGSFTGRSRSIIDGFTNLRPNCPSNLGVEAVVLLEAVNRLMLFCEGRCDDGPCHDEEGATSTPVFLYEYDVSAAGAAARLLATFSYPLVDDLRLSSAALVQNDSAILLLERKFFPRWKSASGGGVLARLRLLPSVNNVLRLEEGSTLNAPKVAELCPSEALTDNFEGLAVDGESRRAWIISDNNYASWSTGHQNTLLFEFELPERLEPLSTARLPQCAVLASSSSSPPQMQLASLAAGFYGLGGGGLVLLGAAAILARRPRQRALML